MSPAVDIFCKLYRFGYSVREALLRVCLDMMEITTTTLWTTTTTRRGLQISFGLAVCM